MPDENRAGEFLVLYAGGAAGCGFSKDRFCRGTDAVKGGCNG